MYKTMTQQTKHSLICAWEENVGLFWSNFDSKQGPKLYQMFHVGILQRPLPTRHNCCKYSQLHLTVIHFELGFLIDSYGHYSTFNIPS